jgi:PAS domain S-box-containing protein
MMKILYTDDEPTLLEIGKMFLEQSGEMQVETATSADEAIVLLEEHMFDAVVSDYQMPGMDGIEFLKHLRGKKNRTPFILFTGRGREEVVIEAINNGADFYLQKGGDPISQFAELEHKIRLAVERRNAEITLLRFNRLYAFLSGTNTTIVRVKSRQELFSEICRIAVEEGNFSHAWIGNIEHDKRSLVPTASYGQHLPVSDSVTIPFDALPLSPEDLSREWQNGGKVAGRAIAAEPGYESWYWQNGLPKNNPLGVFPLFTNDTLTGILHLSARDGIFFSEQEMRLLDKIASDISFALERIVADEKRQVTEASLRESEEKLAAVVAGSPVPKFVIGRDHRILYWNRALVETTGIPADRMIGTRDHWQAFYPTERPTMADLILDGQTDRIPELYAGKILDSPAVSGTHEVVDFFPHLGTSGRWLRFMAAPIRNEQGLIIGAVETLVDITEIKRTEAELRESYDMIAAAEEKVHQQLGAIIQNEERYRNFIETSYEGVWSMDCHFKTAFVNQRLADMFGYHRDEMIGKPIRDFMHPDDRADNDLQLADRQTGKGARYERRFVRKDGSILYTLVSATPIFEDGKFAGSFAMVTDISDRVEMEAQLQRSREQYRNIVDDQTEFICRFLPGGIHVFVNEAYCRYFGISREQVIGHRFRPVIHPDDRDAVAVFFATLTRKKPAGTIDHRIVMADGTVRWQRWSDRAIFDLHGKIVEYQSVGRDITEQKQIEERLQSTSVEYQNLLENMTDVYYRSDNEGRLILASRSFATVLGYPDLTECIGREIATAFYATPHERSLFLEEVYRNGYVTDYEVTLKKKDGMPVSVATSSYLYFDDSGRVLGIEGTFRDITERKKIIENLRETEQRLNDIINFLPDATFAIDRDGTVIAWNRAIEKMTGVPAADVLGKGDYAYALPLYGERRPILIDLIFGDADQQKKNYSFLHREGDVLTAETALANVGGKNLILWGKAGPLYNSRGEVTGAIESIRDFTRRRMLEDTLKQVNKKLNLMSSVTRHDIMNHITVCRGYLELAKDDSHNPEMEKLLGILDVNIRAIQAQIEFTRVYQDLGVAAPVWLNLAGILRECSSPESIPVISLLPSMEVYADPLIAKVFYNLYDNAVRHGCHVTEIRVHAEQRGGDIAIIWEDNGTGVQPCEKEKIFDRGFGRNTGLGLFLVREILGITGISIAETGEYGSGARFEMIIPSECYRPHCPAVPGVAGVPAPKMNHTGGAGHGS